MSLSPGIWAHTDQLVEEARRSIHNLDLVCQPQVALMLADLIVFLNRAGHEPMDLRLRVLALIELFQTTRENPCSDSSSPGSQS